MGPPMRKREGGEIDCPSCFKRLEKPGERKRKENEKKEKKELKKTRAGRFRKRRGESRSFLFHDADQESKTRIRKKRLADWTETSCGVSDFKTGLPYWLGTETINFII
ncbi:hypothetical protein TNCV_2675071 [Trichonephila clavipes]|nr:hypothetical protein TNCV_2675071 [Trichonephila clavipes]